MRRASNYSAHWDRVAHSRYNGLPIRGHRRRRSELLAAAVCGTVAGSVHCYWTKWLLAFRAVWTGDVQQNPVLRNIKFRFGSPMSPLARIFGFF